MAFGGFERSSGPSQPMAEINVTPMVDVMLVLLVIFIVTAPLLAYAIRLDLPEAKAPPITAKTPHVELSLGPDGAVFWNKQRITASDLPARLAAAAQLNPQPELHLRADKDTRYEQLAQLLSAAQQAGLAKIGFVTEMPAAAAPASTK